ncbi:hypothetical protein Hanom_Chr16g01442111 [Helianthus anomalus]
MGGEVLPILQLPCLWAGGGRVSTHLGESRAGGGRLVDLGHSAECHGGWHVVPCHSKKVKIQSPSPTVSLLLKASQNNSPNSGCINELSSRNKENTC